MNRLLAAMGALLLVAVAASLSAQDMPKLPADTVMAQAAGSPGKVVFSHQNHIGFQAKADCTACHPKLAPILRTTLRGKRDAITHAKMEKGHSCGACHNGRAAHGFDDCSSCHKG